MQVQLLLVTVNYRVVMLQVTLHFSGFAFEI